MTVKEMIEELMKMPQDNEVVMFRNSGLQLTHSPVCDVWAGYYAPEKTWGGMFVGGEELDYMKKNYESLKFKPTVCIGPIN